MFFDGDSSADWDYEILPKRQTMAADNCGGPVVDHWDCFFLRDDTEIRRDMDLEQEEKEAYSLFCTDIKNVSYNYGRLIIYTGSKEWAIKKAHEECWKLKEEVELSFVK